MKVLFIHNAFFPYEVGGAEYSLLDRIEGLKLRGIDSQVLTINSKANREDSYTYEGIGVKAMGVPWFRSSPANSNRSMLNKIMWHILPYFGFFYKYFSIRKWILNEKFDAVFVINTPGIPFSICLSRFAPRKYSIVADYNYVCMNGSMYRGGAGGCAKQCTKCSLYSKLKAPILESSDCIVYISSHLERVHHCITKKSGVVIYNGENLAVEPRLNKSIENKEYIVGYIGQVKPNKGVDFLIAQLEKINQERPDFNLRLVVAGGFEELYMKQLASSEIEIDWLGRVDKDYFYSLVDIVAVPSRWSEPLGRVPFEASYRKVPVIVSNRGGLPETVHDVSNIFEIEDKKSFEKCLLRHYFMSATEREAEVLKAYEFAKIKFSRNRSAECYERLLRNV